MDGYNKLGQALGNAVKTKLTIADYKQALQNKLLQSSAKDYVQNITSQNKQEVEQNAFNDSLQKMANEKADPKVVKDKVETANKQAVNKENTKQINKFQTDNFTKSGIDKLMSDADKTNDSVKRLLSKINGYERYKKSNMNKFNNDKGGAE